MITVEISTLPEYFGDGATADDIADFCSFAEKYAAEKLDAVEVEIVDGHPRRGRDEDAIGEEIWQAWLDIMWNKNNRIA